MPGWLWNDDFPRLRDSVERVLKLFGKSRSVRFVELGVAEGKTSIDLIHFIEEWYEKSDTVPFYTYIGVDAIVRFPNAANHPKYHHVDLPSHDAILKLPPDIHWCFIDSCHCFHCVTRDLELYGDRLVPGGEICLHDASPQTQGLDPQNYPGMDAYHDPVEAAKGIDVRRAIDAFMPRPDFRLIQAAPNAERGGIEIYQKVNV